MSTEFKFADDARELAKEVVKDTPELSHIDFEKIVFVRTTKHIKGDYVLAQCVFIPDKLQFISNKTYMIELPPVYDTLNEKQKRIVLEHELYHIPADEKGLIPHSVGEFKCIIDKYGLDWLETFSKANENIKILKEKEKLERKQKKLQEDIVK